ncbi:MAG: DUF4188 domain-containing protein [Candidatus Dormibacteraeota bacterium]|nr:DUF4188 domain-containing protein [Candidatus Dormibacteraeota bacterium]MBO0744652.1 DUF4188 domain-containing protein [Candidatus Dormibacteraeota bacterium]
MATVVPGRVAAPAPPEGTVVFLIGMRVNRLRDVRRWLPVFTAMPAMLRELLSDPDSGLLDATTWISGRSVLVKQYWSSFEKLDGYARDRDKRHRPAWHAFNVRSRGNSAVGIYHETYVVGPGRAESIYVNMPSSGLARAVGALPAETVGDEAPQRLRKALASG